MFIGVIYAKRASDDAFGCSKGLVWPTIKEDIAHFKQVTKNNVVIMGYLTFLSLHSKPLPHRVNIVITHNRQQEHIEHVIFVHSLAEAVQILSVMDSTRTLQWWIIGGCNLIYEALRLQIPSTVYRTLVLDNDSTVDKDDPTSMIYLKSDDTLLQANFCLKKSDISKDGKCIFEMYIYKKD